MDTESSVQHRKRAFPFPTACLKGVGPSGPHYLPISGGLCPRPHIVAGCAGGAFKPQSESQGPDRVWETPEGPPTPEAPPASRLFRSQLGALGQLSRAHCSKPAVTSELPAWALGL